MENGTDENRASWNGFSCAVAAYLIWGLSPVYFKLLKAVPAYEILLHRMVWSFVFLLPLIILRRRWEVFKSCWRSRRTVGILAGSTLLVSCNWFVFIWAINSNFILQASLGYYINPLVNILLGTVFLRERLRRLQIVAVMLAAAGVFYLTYTQGKFPWIALTLAFSFGFYALVRKTAPVEALEGLCAETLMLSFPAVLYLVYLHFREVGAMFQMGPRISFLLMGTAMVTALPLLLFTIGARRLQLITMGFLQYIAPSCTFLLAVFVYGEPVGQSQMLTFAAIWTALGLVSIDALTHLGKKVR